MEPLRHETNSGIDRATEIFMGDPGDILIGDDRAELLLPDQFREIVSLAPVGTDPFVPEQHALNTADPVGLYVTRQEIIKDLEFTDLVIADFDAGHPEQFTELVQDIGVCSARER